MQPTVCLSDGWNAMTWVHALSGFGVGFIVGLTGVGGGSLMTPLLVLLMGIHPAVAVGTDLLYAAFTKAVGAAVHAQRNAVNWRIVGLLGLGSIPATLITVRTLHALALDTARLERVITTTLGVALILTAISLLFIDRLRSRARTVHSMPDSWRVRWNAPVTVATGAVLGVLVTVSSVGAGALGVAALLFLYPRLSAVQIVGTDIAHAVPLTLVAGLGHAAIGTVDWTLLGSLLIGSIPGIWIGSHLASRAPERVLRSLLATILIIVGGKFAL
ncbi:MAG: sulfite exporter TauE/SafE family protein [Burkholderiales bacterium]